MLGTIGAMMLAAGVPQTGTWTAYDDADAHLQAAYDALRANEPPAARITLRDEERAWIKQRDATCGAGSPNGCATRLSRQRTTELEGRLTQAAWYRSLDARGLFALDQAMDDACRGGSGQDPDGAVCKRRDAVVKQLARLGWCWGPDDANEANRRWMRASATCHN